MQPDINYMVHTYINHVHEETAINWQDKKSLFEQLKKISEDTFPDHPIMQRIALCQAVLESRLNGIPSQLAHKYNNFFGIKQSNSNPGTKSDVGLKTKEDNGKTHIIIGDFSSNLTPYDSFNQYKSLMLHKRYEKVFNAKSIFEAFNALQRSGYSTDPLYSSKLSAIYRNQIATLFKDKI